MKIPDRTVKHKWHVRWKCKFLRLWKPSADVARIMGVPPPTVSSWSPGRDRRITKAIKRAIPLLGLDYDTAIGRKVGLSASCIRDHRNQRGIPPYRMSHLKTAYNRNIILENCAEKQVAQELLNAWRAP